MRCVNQWQASGDLVSFWEESTTASQRRLQDFTIDGAGSRKWGAPGFSPSLIPKHFIKKIVLKFNYCQQIETTIFFRNFVGEEFPRNCEI